jgi:hypothetical protein
MPSGRESVDEDGSSPTAQNVKQGESGPRQGNHLDIVAITEYGFKGVRCVDANAVVGGDLVAKADDDQR